MHVDIVTLFPELFTTFLATSMVGRAVTSKALTVRLKNPREFGLGKHRSVDDTPYGGGSGMLMRVDCLVECMDSLGVGSERRDAHADVHASRSAAALKGSEAAQGAAESAPSLESSEARRGAAETMAACSPRAHRVLMCPQGTPLTQAKVLELAARPALALVCGRYEGFDERVRSFVDEEISLGDFVLTGGEVAAMAILDACSRWLPGVLGNAASTSDESHSPAMDGLLEYPQYTRPVEFRGLRVPEVLQTGNHAAIASFRRAEAERRTVERRPDLVPRARKDARDR